MRKIPVNNHNSLVKHQVVASCCMEPLIEPKGEIEYVWWRKFTS